MPITFAVDDVVPATEPLPTQPSRDVLVALAGSPIHAHAPELPLLTFASGAPATRSPPPCTAPSPSTARWCSPRTPSG